MPDPITLGNLFSMLAKPKKKNGQDPGRIETGPEMRQAARALGVDTVTIAVPQPGRGVVSGGVPVPDASTPSELQQRIDLFNEIFGTALDWNGSQITGLERLLAKKETRNLANAFRKFLQGKSESFSLADLTTIIGLLNSEMKTNYLFDKTNDFLDEIFNNKENKQNITIDNAAFTKGLERIKKTALLYGNSQGNIHKTIRSEYYHYDEFQVANAHALKNALVQPDFSSVGDIFDDDDGLTKTFRERIAPYLSISKVNFGKVLGLIRDANGNDAKMLLLAELLFEKGIVARYISGFDLKDGNDSEQRRALMAQKALHKLHTLFEEDLEKQGVTEQLKRIYNKILKDGSYEDSEFRSDVRQLITAIKSGLKIGKSEPQESPKAGAAGFPVPATSQERLPSGDSSARDSAADSSADDAEPAAQKRPLDIAHSDVRFSLFGR